MTLTSDDSDPVFLAGDRGGLDELFHRTYEELRRLAARVKAGDARATINPTALVSEAWLKLAGSPPAGRLSRLHFKRIAARAMRQVLVEAARRRGAAKRDLGAPAVAFDEGLHAAPAEPADVLALDAALHELARMSPRQAAMVEARFFGGLDVAECAALLSLSEATLLRDWRAARAWLAARLRAAD
jgi:RNA polymerase sigma factor (TIGR02999 family)